MRLDDDNHVQDASGPIDVLADYFAAHGWSHEQDGDEEIVATYQGSWAQYELRGIWREEDWVLQFLALPDIRVPEDKRPAIYETMGLINEQLWIGHFEMWSSAGMLLFRHSVLLDRSAEEAAMTIDQAETLIEAAIDECERFYPVFQFVLWGNKTPREAIAAALIETQGEA